MKPVSPVIPGQEEFEHVLAKNQPQYQALPVLVTGDEERRMTSRWEFTDEERGLIASGGSLLVQQLTFGNLFQPLVLSVVQSEVKENMNAET
jgi:hypothetical protein